MIGTGLLLRRLLGCMLLAGAMGWTAGFVWFLHITSQAAAPLPLRVDGIVALTGGPGRVEMALRLLADGGADKLLVTGVGGNIDLLALGRLAGMDLDPLGTRITLGRHAASTRENAEETAAWAAQNRIRSIIVVTASYHMPRALAELRQALPEVQLFPLPIPPLLPADADHAARPHGSSLRLQAEEYTKYLLTMAGLSAWFPHRAAVLPHPGAGAPLVAHRFGVTG